MSGDNKASVITMEKALLMFVAGFMFENLRITLTNDEGQKAAVLNHGDTILLIVHSVDVTIVNAKTMNEKIWAGCKRLQDEYINA